MDEITKKENNLPEKIEDDKDITRIISESEMKKMFFDIVEECDVNIEEAMDSYNIFKDMVTNGTDFDSTIGTKEQLAILLNTAQNASNSKIKIFTEILRAKVKKYSNENKNNILQNNIILGDRRDLISAIESSQHETREIIDTSTKKEAIEVKIETIDEQKESNFVENDQKTEEDYVNRKEEVLNVENGNQQYDDFEIKAGDF